jgi:hypothetical protein
VVTVLPRNADPTANRLAANKLYHLPDEKAEKRFRMTFGGDRLGEEMMVCFATSRDVRTELPAALFPDKFGIIPFLTIEKLRAQFNKLKDIALAEASVTVTVAPKL